MEFRRRFFSHPCRHGQGKRVVWRIHGLQHEADIVVHHMPAHNAKSFSYARMKPVADEDFIVGLVGIISERGSNG